MLPGAVHRAGRLARAWDAAQDGKDEVALTGPGHIRRLAWLPIPVQPSTLPPATVRFRVTASLAIHDAAS